MGTNKKRILLLITNSYAATNVIHSGLIKPLAEQYEVYIISDLIHEKEIVEINDHFQITIFKVDILIPLENRLIRLLRQFEKALFFHFFKIETQEIKEKNKELWYSFLISSGQKLIDSLHLSSALLQFLRKKIILFTSHNLFLKDLYNYNFYGVISSSPLDIRENIIVNFLQEKKVLSLAMIISWDNLTSKGVINADHDYVLVWNDLMKNEYERFYSLFKPSKSQVCITGVPRFDIYFKDLSDKHSAFGFRKKHSIDDSDHVILFATSAIVHFPNQIDIAGHLLEYATQKKNIKIIIRCHPGDNYQLYNRFSDEKNLIVWHPHYRQNAGSVSGWMPDLNMLNSLAEMLKHCTVCINVASTIRLEAAVCNKPNISIAYDGDLKPDFYHSVKRFYAYSHQLPLNKAGIDNLANSKRELFHLLDKALSDSSSFNNTDKIKEFTYHTGPFAVSATMKYINQWLN